MNRQSHRSRKEEVRKSSSEQPTAGGIIRPSCCDDATTPSAAAGCAARCSCCCWCGFALTMIRYTIQQSVHSTGTEASPALSAGEGRRT